MSRASTAHDDTRWTGPKGAGRLVLAMHVALAAFVAVRGYAATQDGPAHLYGAHILWSLKHDSDSPYAGFFSPNLRPAGNSLYSYVQLALEGLLSPERIAGVVLLACLIGLPCSAMAFGVALRRAGNSNGAPELPAVSASCLACPLAYNYFLYRGFFNYSLSLPLALLCLSTLVATGVRSQTRRSRNALAAGALVFAVLASLAHPAALVFLLVAVPAACVRGSGFRRIVGSVVLCILAAFYLGSRIRGDHDAPTTFVLPAKAAFMFLRALGVTHSWLELLWSGLILVLLGCGAVRAAGRFGHLRERFETLWPALLALLLVATYFFVPFEFGGAAGLNERIPLFAALLLLPYVSLGGAWWRSFAPGFAGFAVSTALEAVPRDARVTELRDTTVADRIPNGSRVYLVSLQIKLGSVSADLGRHLLADVARRRNWITAEVFCGHPGHVLRCGSRVPPGYDASSIEDFEQMTRTEQLASLADDASEIRRTFDQIRGGAASTPYVLVLGAPELDGSFQRFVLSPLGAVQLGGGGPVRAYRIP